MPSKPLKLKKISRSQIKMFKVRNRRSYAAICLNNLTEGDDARTGRGAPQESAQADGLLSVD